MKDKFCVYCGAPLEENALFCVGCGNKTDTAPASEQAPGAGASQYTTAQAPAYAPQTPAASYPPQQTGAYNTQYSQPPGPAGGQYYQTPPPAGQNTCSYTPNTPYTGGYGQPKKNRGLLIGGIIGLAVLAIGIVVAVLLLNKPPKAKPDGGSAAVKPGASDSQQTDEAPQSNIKKDAKLGDIAGTWTGKMQMTRMDGFEDMPADQLPADFKEIIAEILAGPAPMELEIQEDGSWSFNVDIETGMMFSSDDYDYDKYEESPMLLTLKNGAFSVTYKEDISEEDMQGSASLEFSGKVYEDGDGLYIEGSMLLSGKQGDVSIVEEGGYKVALSAAAESEAGDDDTGAVDDTDAVYDDTQAAAADFSTNVRPDLGDFLWYLDSVYYDGVPDGSTPVTDFSALSGGWKALFYYDPDNTANAFGYDFLNVSLDGDADNVSMTLDWYMYVAENEDYDKSSEADTILNGSLDQDGITAGNEGYRIFMYAFYEFDGKQYGLGYMELQSGEPTFIALVRP